MPRSAVPAPLFDLPGCSTTTLTKGDDISSAAVPLGFTVSFLGTNYSSVYVNNNGNVTFDAPQSTYTPFNLGQTTTDIIAVFFADVLTSSQGTVTYGQVANDGNGHQAFCVNWLDVAGYGLSASLQNTFQLLIVNLGGGNFDIYTNYAKIQWDTGSLSGAAAGVGYASKSDPTKFYQLAGSLTTGAFKDGGPKALVSNSLNSSTSGRYIFHPRAVAGAVSGKITSGSGGGPAVVAAPVQVCLGGANGQIDGPQNCVSTNSDTAGNYSVVLPLIAGKPFPQTWYTLVWPPSGSNLLTQTVGPYNVSQGQSVTTNVTMQAPAAPPSNVSVSGQGVSSVSGTPLVFVQQPFTITVQGPTSCPHQYQIIQNGVVIASGNLVESPAGTYSATVTLPNGVHGAATVHITRTCGSPYDFTIYIDPSGFVKTVDGTPIAGATVTLFRSDTPDGTYSQVPNGSALMSPQNRVNPDTTDAQGHFGWDVVGGYYKVRASKAGCYAPGNPAQAYVDSSVVTVPPGTTNLDLRLQCGGTAGLGNLKFITPVRILDTRSVAGGPIGFDASGNAVVAAPIPANTARQYKINGKTFAGYTFPADVAGVLLNVTTIQGGPSGGYVTVFPGDQASSPNASTVNPSTAIAANHWEVRVPSDGTIKVFSTNTLDVAIDVMAFYAPSNANTVGNVKFVSPTRVVDTRGASVGGPIGYNQNGAQIGVAPLTGSAITRFKLAGKSFGAVTFPTDITGILAHVTIQQGAPSGGFVTLFAGDQTAAPNASTVNPSTAIAFNTTASGVGTTGAYAGTIGVYSTNQLDLIVDVVGYFSPSNDTSVGSLSFLNTPTRVVDTRGASVGGPIGYDGNGNALTVGAFAPNQTRRFQIGGMSFGGTAIPADAKALLMNVTIQQGGASGGYVIAFPGDGASAPNASTVNPSTAIAASFWLNGLPTTGANAGEEAVFSTNALDVIIDLVGYYR